MAGVWWLGISVIFVVLKVLKSPLFCDIFPVFCECILSYVSGGDVAQLGERLPCTQQVVGSNPVVSTKLIPRKHPRPPRKSKFPTPMALHHPKFENRPTPLLRVTDA